MIQTATGAIAKTDIGTILMHEHISISSIALYGAFGESWLDKKKVKTLACDTLKRVKGKYNLGLLVDATPIDLGRDALLLKEVSKLSDVKIVVSAGFYYLQSIEAFNNSPRELAAWIISECKHGIQGTDIKPGILKCATGNLGLTEDNVKKLSAMAIVQKETGLPLYVHCEHKDDIAFKQLEVLLENGANIEKIIIGHTAMRPDTDYLESILNKGCYICMDQCHCYPHKLTEIGDTLVKLCKKGYTNKILLSNDYYIHSDFANKNTNGLHLSAARHTEGLGYVLALQYKAYMASGGNDQDWETMICKNPLDILDT